MTCQGQLCEQVTSKISTETQRLACEIEEPIVSITEMLALSASVCMCNAFLLKIPRDFMGGMGGLHKLILKSRFSKASNGQEVTEKLIKGDSPYPTVTHVMELQ